MPKVTFVSFEGVHKTVEVGDGETVMFGATQNHVNGIVGECGGFCNCATCHVYVEEPWFSRLPAISEHEDEMLEGTVSERKPTSRLGCQVVVTEELDGIVIHTPELQSL